MYSLLQILRHNLGELTNRKSVCGRIVQLPFTMGFCIAEQQASAWEEAPSKNQQIVGSAENSANRRHQKRRKRVSVIYLEY